MTIALPTPGMPTSLWVRKTFRKCTLRSFFGPTPVEAGLIQSSQLGRFGGVG
jgi:hypothetical protein